MKRLLYRDEEYFYKIFEDSWSAYVNRFIFRIFKKRKRTLFNWSGYKRITEIKGSRDKVSDPENIEKAIEEYLEKDKPLLIKCSAEIESLYK